MLTNKKYILLVANSVSGASIVTFKFSEVLAFNIPILKDIFNLYPKVWIVADFYACYVCMYVYMYVVYVCMLSTIRCL